MITLFSLLNLVTLVMWVRLWIGYSKYKDSIPDLRSFNRYCRSIGGIGITMYISIICGLIDSLVLLIGICIYCP